MSVKEKLVELLAEKCIETCKERGLNVCSTEHCNQHKEMCTGFYADHLIANGVTVQEWIPVKERPPEEWETVLVFKPSIDAIIPAKLRGGSWYATWDATRLEYVSHWRPMPEKPQPPKGE